MANLKHFIWDGSHVGQKLDIYAGHLTKIGTGEWLQVSELNIKVRGTIKILGQEHKGEVEIIMPDLAPKGHCKVIVNGNVYDNCPYEVQGKRLRIEKVADRTLELEAQDKMWSWVGVSGVPTWIGLWPQSAALDLPQFGPQEKAA